MKLQTKIPLQPQQQNQIDYNSNVVLLGSCFSENIGNKINYVRLQNVVNPFGILFHPLAIERFITRVINTDFFNEKELIFHNELWSCLDAHSQLNHPEKNILFQNLNDTIEKSLEKLKNATHIIITLGTSWIYKYMATNAIVANCHKLPQNQFLKELLSVDAITDSLDSTVTLIRSINPKVSFIFTVSPVRHIKDGFVENMQSKSHLITALHQIINPKNRLFYFPSFEIMMDELRDYRFYNEDMLHPNPLAINYIWEKFKLVWLSEEALKIATSVTRIQSKLNHKPIHPNSAGHLKFKEQLKSEIDALQQSHPFIKFPSL